MGELSFVACAESEDRLDEIRRLLEASGHARVAEALVGAGTLPETLDRLCVDALFVSLGKAPEETLTVLERLPLPRPLLLLSGPQENTRILLRAMRLGAKEFFGAELDEEAVGESVHRLLLEIPSSGPADARPGQVLSVIGAKGGIGATSIGCQLAAALQHHDPSAIVDLDVAGGDVAHYLDVTPNYTLANLKTGSAGLDATYLRMLLQKHASGVHVLASPERLEDVELATEVDLDTVCRLLKQEFAWVVLDLPRCWTELTLRALDLSDQILLVTAFEVPVLRHTRRQLDLFQRLGYGNKVRLIVNRASSKDPLKERDFERFLKRLPDASLPNDFETATASIDRGRSVREISADKPLDRAYRTLAARVHEWCGIPVPPGSTNEGWMRRLFQRLR